MQPAAIQWEMLGLAQPVIRLDGMQRMSMMMAMLVLGPPDVWLQDSSGTGSDRSTHFTVP
jgi:hypothetical protein